MNLARTTLNQNYLRELTQAALAEHKLNSYQELCELITAQTGVYISRATYAKWLSAKAPEKVRSDYAQAVAKALNGHLSALSSGELTDEVLNVPVHQNKRQLDGVLNIPKELFEHKLNEHSQALYVDKSIVSIDFPAGSLVFYDTSITGFVGAGYYVIKNFDTLSAHYISQDCDYLRLSALNNAPVLSFDLESFKSVCRGKVIASVRFY